MPRFCLELGFTEAVGTNEVSPLPLPRELRALPVVTSVSSISLNIGGLDGRSAHRNPMLPVPVDTALPRAELSIAPPPASTSPSRTPHVHHKSVASVSRSPNADPEPARVVASASSEPSPSTHPAFAAFLEAASAKRARALTTKTNDAKATSSPPPPPTWRPSTTPSSPSSRAPGYPPASCDHPQCIRAAERIQDIICLQQGRLTHDLYRAAVAAHQVVVDCTRARIIAAFRECLVVLHGMGSARNQGFHVPFYDVCRSTGLEPATLPALTGVPLPPNWPHWKAYVRGVVGHAAHAGRNVA